MTNKIVVFSTCDSAEEAERLARQLVEARLAACVNVISQLRSYYRWNGRVQSSTECMLIIKSSRELFEQLRLKLESVHSYELPEVLALPIVAGSPNFLAWLDAELTGDARG
ncbi:MAG: divalent-cation tolerance protein CutA [Acidobacteriota bacterium]